MHKICLREPKSNIDCHKRMVYTLTCNRHRCYHIQHYRIHIAIQFIAYRRYMKRKISFEMQSRVDDMVISSSILKDLAKSDRLSHTNIIYFILSTQQDLVEQFLCTNLQYTAYSFSVFQVLLHQLHFIGLFYLRKETL